MGVVNEKYIENKNKGDKVKAYCIECKRIKNHMIMVSADKGGSEEYDQDCWIGWEDNYQVIQCVSCETFSFRHLSWFSEYVDPPHCNGQSETLYPKRDESYMAVKEFLNVPKTLRRIYRETIHSYNEECYTLCAAGLRAIVEGICANQSVIDGPVERQGKDGAIRVIRKDNLEGKIAGLCEKGILTASSATILHQHRYLGNEAVHELAQPSLEELKLAIEILEHTFEQLYEIPKKASRLSKERCRRMGQD